MNIDHKEEAKKIILEMLANDTDRPEYEYAIEAIMERENIQENDVANTIEAKIQHNMTKILDMIKEF